MRLDELLEQLGMLAAHRGGIGRRGFLMIGTAGLTTLGCTPRIFSAARAEEGEGQEPTYEEPTATPTEEPTYTPEPEPTATPQPVIYESPPDLFGIRAVGYNTPITDLTQAKPFIDYTEQRLKDEGITYRPHIELLTEREYVAMSEYYGKRLDPKITKAFTGALIDNSTGRVVDARVFMVSGQPFRDFIISYVNERRKPEAVIRKPSILVIAKNKPIFEGFGLEEEGRSLDDLTKAGVDWYQLADTENIRKALSTRLQTALTTKMPNEFHLAVRMVWYAAYANGFLEYLDNSTDGKLPPEMRMELSNFILSQPEESLLQGIASKDFLNGDLTSLASRSMYKRLVPGKPVSVDGAVIRNSWGILAP